MIDLKMFIPNASTTLNNVRVRPSHLPTKTVKEMLDNLLRRLRRPSVRPVPAVPYPEFRIMGRKLPNNLSGHSGEDRRASER